MRTTKRLNYDDRLQIEKGLKNKMSFKEIGRLLDKDANTIRNEIKKYSKSSNKVSPGRVFNDCIFRKKCPKRYGSRSCSEYNHCDNYIKVSCKELSKPPYCCNACPNFRSCVLSKKVYIAEEAQKQHEFVMKESRTGINMNEREIEILNKLLNKLIKENNQSIHHAYINNKDLIMCSERQIYKLIEKNVLSIGKIDLQRTVQRKRRNKLENHFKIDKNCRINRTYNDYLEFRSNHNDLSLVEMDSVLGVKGGKCLLTLHFVSCNFMLAFIRDNNDSQSVIDTFNYLEDILGEELFTTLFGIVLTDNGSEFSNPLKLEFDKNGKRRTFVFYCDPGHSEQKGSCENNHELIRRVLPKGTSFDKLEQEDICKMMSHINSYKRKALNDCCPLQLFSVLYGFETASKLGIMKIKPNDIVLKKDLFTR